MNKIERIQDLTIALNHYRNQYYNLDNPTISDQEYDKLFDDLSALEKETGFTLVNSPTVTVGYDVVSKLQKRVHPTLLKSLDKTKSIDELNNWRNGQDCLFMLKDDGLTVELDYDNGKLVEAATRGNGEVGELITHNAMAFKNIPLSIPFRGKLRVVGEAIIHWNDFHMINADLPDEEKYATPRNLVAGSVRQLDASVCADREVYFYAFNVLERDSKLSDSKLANFEWLVFQGFDIVAFRLITNIITHDDIVALTSTAKTMSIPIDGLVATYDSIKYSDSLGETSHHPLHSMAFKFADEAVETVLRNVEWNTTRMGQVNPTAIFDTVILDNTDVSRASLHNLSFIEALNLNIGNRILVSKRNLIIPHVEDNLDRDGVLMSYPEECPSCGGRTHIKNTGTANFLFCANKQCPAQLLDKFVHFVKRDCMNIDGLSESTLEKFINAGFLKTFDDIYGLDQYKSKIVQMDGFGIKSYNKLIVAIDKSKKVKLANFIYALGIPNIGKNSSKILAKTFNNDWFEFEKALLNGFNFATLTDFGDITNDSLHKWYYDDNEITMWSRLTSMVEFVVEKKQEVTNTDNPFAGKKIYATGTFARSEERRVGKECRYRW